jgi:hypothetical protein
MIDLIVHLHSFHGPSFDGTLFYCTHTHTGRRHTTVSQRHVATIQSVVLHGSQRLDGPRLAVFARSLLATTALFHFQPVPPAEQPILEGFLAIRSRLCLAGIECLAAPVRKVWIRPAVGLCHDAETNGRIDTGRLQNVSRRHSCHGATRLY